MASNNQQNKNKQNRPVPKGAKKPVSNVRDKEQGIRSKAELSNDAKLNWMIVGAVLLLTFICYHFTLDNQFTNWDDGVYLYENSYVKNLTPANLKMILFHNITDNYYHPITMLSLALQYHWYGMNPQPYYITEIVIHLASTALVFFLALSLLNAMVKKGYGNIKGIPYWAGLCALWQGIHPMHVESVSWLAERKDVLYLFFYLLGMVWYVKYLMQGKIFQYVLVVLFFILSLFSKPLAVVFPLSLLTIDLLLKRDKTFNIQSEGVSKYLTLLWKLMINKIPFFIVSLIFGIIAYVWAKEGGSITSFEVFSKLQRVTFVGVNYLSYLGKLFVPTHLCSYYPYPQLNSTNWMPWFFYVAPPLSVIITGGALWLAYKGGENYFRVALFGFAYYFFNVMFILQFVSAGPSIMADRYSYASYFGFTFMLIYFFYVLVDKKPQFKYPAYGVLIAFTLMLGVLCEARTRVWHNTRTLWEDVISKYPAGADTVYSADHTKKEIHIRTGVETSYKNLGNFYAEENPPNYDSAYMYFKVLQDINSKDAGVYSNIGNIWAIRGDFKKSLAAYTRALSIDSTGKNSFDIYLDRGITYARMNQNELALNDYNHADKLSPNCQKLYENRAYLYMNGLKQMDSAIADYNRLLSIEKRPDYYLNRGIAEFNKNDYKDAISDFSIDVNMDPKSVNGYFNLSIAYKDIKEYSKALSNAIKAQSMGYKLPDNYLNDLQESVKKEGN